MFIDGHCERCGARWFFRIGWPLSSSYVDVFTPLMRWAVDGWKVRMNLMFFSTDVFIAQ